MALQSIDFKVAKQYKTTSRTKPALVNRSNKRIARELMPQHAANAPRMGMWATWYKFS